MYINAGMIYYIYARNLIKIQFLKTFSSFDIILVKEVCRKLLFIACVKLLSHFQFLFCFWLFLCLVVFG